MTSTLSSPTWNRLVSSHSSSRSAICEFCRQMMTRTKKNWMLAIRRVSKRTFTQIHSRRDTTNSLLYVLFPSPSLIRSQWGVWSSLGPASLRPSVTTSCRRAPWGTTTCWFQSQIVRLSPSHRGILRSISLKARQYWEWWTYQIFSTATSQTHVVSSRRPSRRTRLPTKIILGCESLSRSWTSTKSVSAIPQTCSIHSTNSQSQWMEIWSHPHKLRIFRNCFRPLLWSRWGQRARLCISHAWRPSLRRVPRCIPHFKGWMRIIPQSSVISPIKIDVIAELGFKNQGLAP